MADFALPTLAIAAAVLLVGAGVAHLGRPGDLRAALDAQRLLPPVGRAAVARLLGAGEVAVGLAAGWQLLTGRTGAPGLAGLAVALVGLGFAVLLVVLLRYRPGTPCGCAGGTDPVTVADLGRAVTVLTGGLALTADASGRWLGLDGAERATTLLAGLALALTVDLAARSHRTAIVDLGGVTP